MSYSDEVNRKEHKSDNPIFTKRVSPYTLNSETLLPEQVVAIQGNASYVYTYNVDNTINYITKTIGTTSYRKTFTYVGALVTAETRWIKQ